VPAGTVSVIAWSARVSHFGNMSLLCTARKALVHCRIPVVRPVHAARQLVGANTALTRFCSSESKAAGDSKAPKVASSDDDDKLADGEILLYKESQMTSILMMLGCSGVNLMVSHRR
jgi:hypothetical protein